mmetsp:Transcript_21949/g.45332  ORF Transcript_21949/g.45332 Transcript_21949/m.45332 type:complete len:256 (+) Transcript_21949:2572-3339(+)
MLHAAKLRGDSASDEVFDQAQLLQRLELGNLARKSSIQIVVDKLKTTDALIFWTGDPKPLALVGVTEPSFLLTIEGVAKKPIVASGLAVNIVWVIGRCALGPVHAIPFEEEHGKEVSLSNIGITRTKLHRVVVNYPVCSQRIRRPLVIHFVTNKIVDRIADGIKVEGGSRLRGRGGGGSGGCIDILQFGFPLLACVHGNADYDASNGYNQQDSGGTSVKAKAAILEERGLRIGVILNRCRNKRLIFIGTDGNSDG